MLSSVSHILIIDTSTDVVALSLGISSLDAESLVVAQRAQHSENISLALDELFRKRDISHHEIAAIGIGVGPGMFTGLRVGIATAHAYAQVLNIPLVFLSSLEIVARSTCKENNISGDIIVARDARRHELYSARYYLEDKTVEKISIDSSTIATSVDRIEIEQLITPEQFVHMVNTSKSTIILDDINRYEEYSLLSPERKGQIMSPIFDPRTSIDLVKNSVQSSIIGDVYSPQPLYIRKSDAELSWGKL